MILFMEEAQPPRIGQLNSKNVAKHVEGYMNMISDRGSIPLISIEDKALI